MAEFSAGSCGENIVVRRGDVRSGLFVKRGDTKELGRVFLLDVAEGAIMRSLRWLAVAAVVVGTTVVAAAQSSEPVCSLGNSGGLSYGGGFNKKTPYSLTAKSSFEQRLADGSYVRSYARIKLARDGEGRTMTQWPQGCYRGEDGQLKLKYNVNVYDPTTKSSLMWNVSPGAEKVASGARSQDFTPNRPTEAEMAERRKEMQLMRPSRSEFKTEDLGTKTIAGFETHGSRTTRTIPAGEEGNEVALVTVQETWTSKELGLTMLGISDDPRSGRRTYEVEEFTQGEPDASLFAPPEGYKVEYRKTVVVADKPETPQVDGVR
jgi:hypothetical protein